MATKKISQLTPLTTANNSIEFLINDAGVSKKITRANIFSTGIDVTGSVTVGSGTASTYVDLILNGASTSNYGPLLQLQSGGATFGKITNYGRIQGGTSTDMFVTTSTTNSLILGTNNSARMTITSTGVGIGTSLPNRQLNVENTLANSGGVIGLTSSDSSTTGSLGIIHFGNSTDSSLVSINGIADGSTSAGALVFKTEGAGGAIETRMTISSTGNVLVGTNDTTVYDNSAGTTADNGLNLRGDGKMDAARYNAPPLGLNRTGTDGTLLDIRKDGTSVGSISVSGTGTLYNTGSTGGIDFSGQTSTTATDAAASSGGEVLDHYEEGTWTPNVGGDATYTSQVGHYTKVGRLVNIRMNLQINTLGTGSTYLISGLPFTSSATGNPTAFASVSNFQSLALSVIEVSAFVGGSGTTMNMTGLTTAGASTSTGFGVFGNSARVDLTVTYFV